MLATTILAEKQELTLTTTVLLQTPELMLATTVLLKTGGVISPQLDCITRVKNVTDKYK